MADPELVCARLDLGLDDLFFPLFLGEFFEGDGDSLLGNAADVHDSLVDLFYEFFLSRLILGISFDRDVGHVYLLIK